MLDTVVVIILLEACVLDVAIVGATTPAGAPLSQANLISWSLPCFNLTLTITVSLIVWIRQSHNRVHKPDHPGAQLPVWNPNEAGASST